MWAIKKAQLCAGCRRCKHESKVFLPQGHSPEREKVLSTDACKEVSQVPGQKPVRVQWGTNGWQTSPPRARKVRGEHLG